MEHLQVLRLWDADGLQGDGGHQHVASLSYPALSRPVEAGPLQPCRLQLRETGRLQLQLGKLEGDAFGSFVEAAEGSGHPVGKSGLEWSSGRCAEAKLPRPHRLKLLYSGRFGRGSGAGILTWMLSARVGSLRISWSQGEW